MRGAVVLVALQLAAGKTCDRTYRLGAQHAAAPSSVSMMTSGFDIEGACVAFYDQPSGVIALERVEQCGNQPVRQAGLEVLFTILAASTQRESLWRPRTRRLTRPNV